MHKRITLVIPIYSFLVLANFKVLEESVRNSLIPEIFAVFQASSSGPHL